MDKARESGRRQAKTEGLSDAWQSVKNTAKAAYDSLKQNDEDAFNNASRKVDPSGSVPFPDREKKRNAQLKSKW